MSERDSELTVIAGRKRSALAPDQLLTFEPGPQRGLFPRYRPGVFVFVCFPDVQEKEFVELMENARPSYVIDLRIVPRFDVGRLNRDRAFALFWAVLVADIWS